MSLFTEKQVYCPNCGKPVRMVLYLTTVLSQVAIKCSRQCYDDLSMKVTRSMMRKLEPGEAREG